LGADASQQTSAVVSENRAALLQDQGKSTRNWRRELDRSISDHSITTRASLLALQGNADGVFWAISVSPPGFSARFSLRSNAINSARSNAAAKLHDLLIEDRELIPDLLAEGRTGNSPRFHAQAFAHAGSSRN